MNGRGSNEVPWSPRRWGITIGLMVLLQAGLAWTLADRTPLETLSEQRPFQIRQVPAEQAASVAALLDLLDPTRLVLPSEKGFSGPAWLAERPLVHKSPGWSSPPEWLRFNPAGLLADLAVFGSTNHPVRASVAERLSRPTESRLPLSAEMLPPRATRFQLTGEITRGDLRLVPEFPVIEHLGMLSPTVISLQVDERGRVFSPALRSSSGNVVADQQALKVAWSLVFNVRPGFEAAKSGDDFGQFRRALLTVHWWTQPPAATNPPATPPPTVQPLP